MDTQQTPAGEKQSRPQVAVWYFVGATFAFAWSAGVMPGTESGSPLSIIMAVGGVVAFVGGCIVLRRELLAAKADKADRADKATEPE